MGGGWKWLAAVYVPAWTIVVLAVIVPLPGVDHPVSLTRDPLALLGAPLYIGALSLLGGLLWAFAAGSCLVVGLSVWRNPTYGHWGPFLLMASLANVWLAIDDTYQFHERIMAHHIGIPEAATIGAYVLALAIWMTWHRDRFRVVLRDPLFASAMLLLASAVAVDVVLPFSDTQAFVEDAIAFAGLAGWTVAWMRVAVSVSSWTQEGRREPEPSKST